MNRNTISTRGFSLIEVVLATALLAFSIVAVVGLVGVVGRSVTDVEDFATASQLTKAIEDELLRLDFSVLESMQSEFIMYASAGGDRVALETNAGNDPLNGNPPGIAPGDRYFRIALSQVGYNTGGSASPQQLAWEGQLTHGNYSTFLALKVEVRWPHAIPQGPAGGGQAVIYDTDAQRIAVFYLSIPEKP